jgi:transcriptional regulator GlxA family with amidase domain
MLLLPGFNSLAAHAFSDPFRVANYLHGMVFLMLASFVFSLPAGVRRDEERRHCAGLF